MKLEKIIEASEALSKIDRTSLETKISYRINKILGKTFDTVKKFHKDRDALIVKYGKEDEKTKQFSVPPENMELVTKEIEKLMQKEVEIVIEQIPLSLLEGVKMTPQEVRMAEDFIKDDLTKSGEANK